MRSLILAIIFISISANAFALEKVWIIYKANEEIVVIHPAPKAKYLGETDGDFLDRVYNDAVDGTELDGLPYEDMLKSSLPSRNNRDKWRGRKGQGVNVNHSVITKAEKRQAVEDGLDAELAKPSPDSIKILKLQRKLDKKDY